MPLQKIVLGGEPSLSLSDLVQQASRGGVEVQDGQGKPLAFVLCPGDREAWAWAEAIVVLGENRGDGSEAKQRRTGISTKELLQRAGRAGKAHDLKEALATVTDLMKERIDELEDEQSRAVSAPDKQAFPKKAG